jgi:hypothetical protein
MSRPFSFPSFPGDRRGYLFEYLRTYSQELGSRIVEMYPPVRRPNDPIAKQVATLLRKPLPAQALTITGLAKHLKTARSVRIVGECGSAFYLNVIRALPDEMAVGLRASVKFTEPSNTAIKQHFASGKMVEGVEVKRLYHLRTV